MSTKKLDTSLERELTALKKEGRAKSEERVIQGYIPPKGAKGPRYKLLGSDNEFIRLNSNSYLSLSHHPKLIAAADEATHEFGVGPGAVRFIDGTFVHHQNLEQRIADFLGKPAAKIFNSAYTANCGLACPFQIKRPIGSGTSSTTTALSGPCASAISPRQTRAFSSTMTWQT